MCLRLGYINCLLIHMERTTFAITPFQFIACSSQQLFFSHKGSGSTILYVWLFELNRAAHNMIYYRLYRVVESLQIVIQWWSWSRLSVTDRGCSHTDAQFLFLMSGWDGATTHRLSQWLISSNTGLCKQ